VKPSPTSIFVVSAIALACGVGLVATRSAQGAADDGPPLPSDAPSFGFVVRSRVTGVPLLESTKPFQLSLSNGPVHGVRPDPARLTRGALLVARELGRYPASFLRNVHLAGIVLTEDLSEGDTPIPSLPNVGGLLLLDVSSVESDLVRSLHHEIFHFFDLADDGTVSVDRSWDALNRPGFVYGSGGRTLRGSWAAHPSSDLLGFVSAYATSASAEDKADTFAFAVTRAPLMKDRLRSDSVLRSKVDELARRVGALDADTPRRLGLDDLIAR
jgi:hypothetical protein